MKAKSIGKVEIPDGFYRARLGGKTVAIRTLSTVYRFDIDVDINDMSIGVYVTIKNGYATVISNNHY